MDGLSFLLGHTVAVHFSNSIDIVHGDELLFIGIGIVLMSFGGRECRRDVAMQ